MNNLSRIDGSDPTLSRRRFLQRAVGASTVFAVPNIFSGPLFGAAAPSNRVAVGQIGCGNIGSNYHIPLLTKMDDVRIVAVADAYKSRREATAAKLNTKYGEGTVKAHADFREILARPDVDAVIIGNAAATLAFQVQQGGVVGRAAVGHQLGGAGVQDLNLVF